MFSQTSRRQPAATGDYLANDTRTYAVDTWKYSGAKIDHIPVTSMGCRGWRGAKNQLFDQFLTLFSQSARPLSAAVGDSCLNHTHAYAMDACEHAGDKISHIVMTLVGGAGHRGGKKG